MIVAKKIAFETGIRYANARLFEYQGIKLMVHPRNGVEGEKILVVSEETTGRMIPGTFAISHQEAMNYARFIIDKNGAEKVKEVLSTLTIINPPTPAPSPTTQTETCPE